ncbi:laccase domain-containing protein [Sulfurimonas sp. MAG313]|nr:laccase domain-containing protein [Sulfurimonas sp. MAG313]
MQSIESNLLKQHPSIKHAFSTRAKGYSKKPFSQNNLAFHIKDNPKHLKNNHLIFSKYLNYDINKLVYMDQVHGKIVKLSINLLI